ncbi:hypothetical protein BDD12DRAFT_885221 [Trichophaea hybrida]|nr:hypothetical protein BDD12DRAFT_885221 [Trichophaea hybrida]
MSSSEILTENTAALSVKDEAEAPLGESFSTIRLNTHNNQARPDGKPLTKSALKKLQKEKEKAEKAAARKAQEDAAKAAREAANVDHAKEFYGKHHSTTLPLVPTSPTL